MHAGNVIWKDETGYYWYDETEQENGPYETAELALFQQLLYCLVYLGFPKEQEDALWNKMLQLITGEKRVENILDLKRE